MINLFMKKYYDHLFSKTKNLQIIKQILIRDLKLLIAF